MTSRQRIELRRSQIRERLGAIAKLEGELLTDDVVQERGPLLTELESSEAQLQAAIAADETESRQRGDQLTGDGEDTELRALHTRANVGTIFAAALEHRATDGAESELQAHFKLGANQIPLSMLRTEARAVTPAPADVGANQQPVIPGVFPMSCAAFLGIDMPTVPVGEAIFPVLSTNADVGVPAENAAQAETTGSFSAEALAPSRLQASFFYSREDAARFAMMDEALRMNLSDALADALDKQIISGANGLLTAQNLGNNNVNAVTDFANYIANFGYGRVDGTYAAMTADLRAVMGSATYAHAGSVYRNASVDRNAIDRLMEITGGVKVSAHVPNVAANKQNAVIRLGMRRDMVAPVWEGVTLIPDEITKAANGQIVLTAVMLHAVKIVRAAGFRKQQTQHA